MKLSFFSVVASFIFVILSFTSCKPDYVPWTRDLMQGKWNYKTVQTEVFEGTTLLNTKIETLVDKYAEFGQNDGGYGDYSTNLPKEDVPNQLETNPTTWRAMNNNDVILEGEDYYYPIFVKTINDKELIFIREYEYEENGIQKRSVFTYTLEKQK